ncbi:hypothetical protein [Zavarzinia compransoris]|uniref:hypothetical protein n=1 Tax=Zavarzinia compransoris TaxID=1264899 RepID=UPI0010EB1AA1|nr:hypothetical protein [Zavarzinia compransoris]TDP43307.1 hypothetical protein DES42_1128 [Zavarzinia compransoris]
MKSWVRNRLKALGKAGRLGHDAMTAGPPPARKPEPPTPAPSTPAAADGESSPS